MTSGAKEFENIIASSDKVGIIGHFNPDGDSVGSVSAALHYLTLIGKKGRVILPSGYPHFLEFLDKKKDYLIFTDSQKEAADYIASCDALICLDFNRLDRTEGLQEHIRKSNAKKILVDHHPDPEKEHFDFVYSTVETSSTCELFFWLLMECSNIMGDVMKLPFDCAEALATGMITDTNNFNNSVVATTFEMASLLKKRGVAFDWINKTVFASYSQNRMRLMGTLLSQDMKVIEDLGAAYILLSKERQNEFDFQIGDSEGFVNLPLSIKEVGITALFVENENYVRVSLRSDGRISVNRLSNMYFNGGGHDKAAGGRLYIPFNEVSAYFETHLREFIEKEAYDLQS